MAEPCYRHSRRAWIANCEICTDWHLSRQMARRAGTRVVETAPDTRPRHLQAA
ncbi:hypothetical protein ACI789_17260 [Geodermatophilus sp. SYSU D00965]